MNILRGLAVIVPSLMVCFAEADYQLDINGGSSNYVNSDLNGYTDGYNYPGGGSPLSISGVGFGLATYPSSSDVGVVFSGNSSGPVAVYDYTGLSYAVGASDSLFTLINSGDGGTQGTPEGTIEVFGTDGAYASLNLVEGFNIRDHFNGIYCNTVTDLTVVSTYFNGGNYSSDPAFGPDRLDRQELVLGSSFNGQTVTEIKFTFDNNGFPGGSPFLAAATISDSAAPEPGSVAPTLRCFSGNLCSTPTERPRKPGRASLNGRGLFGSRSKP